MAKSALDKDLQKVVQLEEATHSAGLSFVVPGLTITFLFGAAILGGVSFGAGPLTTLVVIASLIAGYMALNVGANDVANNMGPAVGSRALTLSGALAIAAVCEAAGALIAGGDVVGTISRGLVRAEVSFAVLDFVFVMMAAFLAAGMWIHLATFLGAPVSTTHAIVGGVVGSAVAAAGVSAVIWPVLGTIVASWVVSPALGGGIAALLLLVIDKLVVEREDRVAAARRVVPLLVGLMAGIFSIYLMQKGLARIWHPGAGLMALGGAVVFVLGTFSSKPWVARRAKTLAESGRSISRLFVPPLIFSTALLSFAHGANDVANAVGPLAAIVDAASHGIAARDAVVLPFWVLLIGGIGIAVGLSLFGPRVIRTVGEKITKMNEIRAFCVALSAAITVLVASGLGLPVSSTHIAVGAIFGVGFLREYKTNRGIPNPGVQPRSAFLKTSRLNQTPEEAVENFQKRERRRLVRRRHVLGIVAAWVVTVPASALLSALLYGLMRMAALVAG
ncbi:inorganic phosphate transporter, PiT family [Fulvimarina manganoxydans]|uniref:Phosphate transporter n=1 Tax=Fulvimarina manganoxydans TaxID=937218 RepID=A0A1W2E5R2_9HYPH|nr:inorganic phosphate transporter [Fulvimarina manganoxydans]SMD04656.1 inorganic phosphate transporter, PiT family [Fulvimarina manganoxydans]